MKTYAIIPRTIPEVKEVAAFLYESPTVKAKFKTLGATGIIVLKGLEIGFTPMEAVDALYMISSTICMKAEAMLSLARSSGLMESYTEEMKGSIDAGDYRCEAITKRKDMDKEAVSVYSMQDAKTAGLWAYNSTWKKFPQRMLKARVRSFLMRDEYSEAMCGLMSVEEMSDVEKQEDKNIIFKKPKTTKHEQTKDIPTEQPETLISKLLGEKYIIDHADDSYHLESGITYTKEDRDKWKGLSKDEIQSIHRSKKESTSMAMNKYIELFGLPKED